MNILILGSGGREHALAWAVMQNPKCDKLIVAPGNAGIAKIADCASLNAEDGGAVVTFAEQNAIDFVIVGPEAPLAAGVADRLRDAGILVFGPSEAAARLEASKSFTKEICDAANAPTAGYGHFTDAEAAKAHVRANGAPIVVKADGLAAGKGVIVAMDEQTALDAIDDMFGGAFGGAGAEVVIEEFMEGEEASLFVLCDGEEILSIGTAQDHKRVGEGDTGLNTGGMGAVSPAPRLDEALQAQVMEEIVSPLARGMADEAMPYRGILYVGLMLTDTGPQVIEFNCRLGDPEAQVILPRLRSDLGAAMLATVISGTEGAEASDDVMLFHAGTKIDADGTLRAHGGRVLAVTGLGRDVGAARGAAYGAVDKIGWPGGFCRRDIAAE